MKSSSEEVGLCFERGEVDKLSREFGESVPEGGGSYGEGSATPAPPSTIQYCVFYGAPKTPCSIADPAGFCSVGGAIVSSFREFLAACQQFLICVKCFLLTNTYLMNKKR